MIKKPLFIFCFSLLLAINVFAQKDSTYKRGITIKIDPIQYMLGPAIQESYPSEYSGFIEVPFAKYWDVIGGYGFNTDTHGSGNTIHLGFSVLNTPHSFVSFLFFYRTWNLTNIHNYDPTPFHSLNDYPGGEDDYILNLTTRLPSAENDANIFYSSENAQVQIYGFAMVYDRQGFIGNSKHMIWEWYIGIGYRSKDIQINTYSQTDQNGQGYYPYTQGPTNQAEHISEPDLKLGFMIGYKL